MKKPLVLDLFCGLGGWSAGFLSEGWRAVGVDIADFSKQFPGVFIQADLLTWENWRNLSPLLVVASPPCEEFSRWSMPWTRAKNPPVPSLDLWNRSKLIAQTLGVPLIIENVRGAQKFVGPSHSACGPFHLWGNVPAGVPDFSGRKKESYGSKERARRALIPLNLSRHVARSFAP